LCTLGGSSPTLRQLRGCAAGGQPPTQSKEALHGDERWSDTSRTGHGSDPAHRVLEGPFARSPRLTVHFRRVRRADPLGSHGAPESVNGRYSISGCPSLRESHATKLTGWRRPESRRDSADRRWWRERPPASLSESH